MKRKPISKKLRFEVFKRDGFTCQYCGSVPPVPLQVDHIHPVSKGGGNHIDQLVTACQPCNIGKGANLLSDIPQSLKNKAKEVAENELQIKEYNKILASKGDRIETDIWRVVDRLEGEELEHYDRKKLSSLTRFVGLLTVTEMLEAADITSAKFGYTGSAAWRYFCAICWNKIKGVSPNKFAHSK